MTRLQMAVVGVGSLGQHHARILSEQDSVELISVTDTDPGRAADVAKRCGTEWFTDHHPLLDRVDAVIIAVPTLSHFAVATEFLKRRIPVLVEKPIAGNLQEAEELVRLADSHQTLLQVGHVERFNPATQVLKKGCCEPKYIRADRLSPFSFRSVDIGVVHDLMIHDIDLVLDLVRAPVKHVAAFGVSIMGAHEDTAQARLTFENGCIADLTASRVSTTAQRTMQTWSQTGGCVTADFNSRDVVSYTPTETLLFGTSPLERARQPDADIDKLKQEVFEKYIKVERQRVPATDALTAELTSFVDCVIANRVAKGRKLGSDTDQVAGVAREPVVSGLDALAAMRVAELVLDAIAAHAWDGHAQSPVGPFLQQPARKLAG